MLALKETKGIWVSELTERLALSSFDILANTMDIQKHLKIILAKSCRAIRDTPPLA